MKGLDVSNGDKFNFLTVIKESEPKTVDGRRPKRTFLCECICHRRLIVRLDCLRNNKKSSCGCQLPIKITKTNNPVTKHGYSRHPLYKIWKGIRSRCYRVTNPNYFRYGGRGIIMCDEWYMYPEKFIEWSIKNGYKPGLELDRENNNDGYFPDNCRWVTSEINNNNKRSNKFFEYKGEWLTLPQISKREKWIGFPTLYRRVNGNGLTIKEALSIPLHKKCKKGFIESVLVKDFTKIKYIKNSKKSWRKLGEELGISQTTIWRIKKGIRPYLFN